MKTTTNRPSFADKAWDSDITLATTQLSASKVIRDEAYWFATIGLVEEGIDPGGSGRPVLLSALSAWVARCLADPKEEEPHASRPPARPISPDRVLPNAPPE